MSIKELKANEELPYQHNLLLCGFTSGLLAGLVSSEIFVSILAIVLLITDGNILGTISLFFWGQFYGVFPSLGIGMLFGSLMAIFFRFSKIKMTLLKGSILGFLLAFIWGAVLVFVITYALNRADPYSIPFLSSEASWLWLELLIIVLYLLSGTWCGRELARCKLLPKRNLIE